MFLRNNWYIAAESKEVRDLPLGRQILGEPIVFYRGEGGKAYALEDRCCHRLAPLHKGKIEGNAVRCGYHGFVFDHDGKCIEVPGSDRVPPRYGVRSYPLRERYRYLWIWMGEPELADESTIPDFHYNDDPAWAATSALLNVKGNYLLLLDNFMDLSHVNFVHANTIGSDDTSAQLTLANNDDFVRLTREPLEVPTPPNFLELGLADRIQQSKIITFRPPCTVTFDVSRTEVLDASTKRSPKSMHQMILNAATPETETSTHYFWSSTRDFDIHNAGLTEAFHRITVPAFDEDKDMIEAQQRCIDINPEYPFINAHIDSGGVYVRRCIAQRLKTEVAAQRRIPEKSAKRNQFSALTGMSPEDFGSASTQ